MKKIFSIVLGISLFSIAFVFQGCNKLAGLLQYDLNYTTADATVTFSVPDTLIHNSMASSLPVNINLDSFIKASTNNQLSISSIKHANITSCSVTLQNADSANNFQNLKSFSALFSTNLSTAPIAIGNISNNPNVYSATMNIPVDSTVDYAQYLSAANISYYVGGQARKVTTKSLVGKMTISFRVHVGG